MANFVSARTFMESLGGLGEPEAIFVSVSRSGQLQAGNNPAAPSHYFDFQLEEFRGVKPVINTPHAATSAPEPTPMHGRTTGVYSVEIQGVRRSYGSLKQLLKETILQISGGDPDFLKKLSEQKSRTRRIVARTPKDLFDKEHLADAHAEPLMPGWWLNTNNSSDQVKKWVFVAASLANLSLNKDIRLSF